MPVEDNINAVKTAFTGHISLTATTFFSRATEENDRSLMTLCEPLRNSHSTCSRTCAKEIVSATVTRSACLDCLLICNRILRHAWQGIILGKNTDYRASGAVFCDKCCRYSGNTPFNTEAVALKMGCKQFAALILQITELCKCMNLLLHGIICTESRLYIYRTCIRQFRLLRLFCRRRKAKHKSYGNDC